MTLDAAAALCRHFEGLYLRPYLCPAGVWTIGYGSTFYENGRRVQPDDPAITRERAEELLMWELRGCAASVRRLCPGLASAAPNAFQAIVDYTFNLGAGRLQTSTLRRRLNAGDWVGAAAELRRWVRGGGRVLPGLVRRREAECLLLGA